MSKQVFKKVYKYTDVNEKIMKAVDTIADPIKQTMSPKGRNVLFEDANGNYFSTNDGVTIAKNINVTDPVENMIIEIIKGSSLKTNSEVGDGTSTSILLSQVLIKEGLKLVSNGMNPMDLKKELEAFGEKSKKNLKKNSIKIKDDKDLFNIANISANNDAVIAKDIVKVVKTAGLDGMVFIEPNNKTETEIVEDTGFIIGSGLFTSELRTDKNKFSSTYKGIPVFITDKRLYYKEEAETILKTVLMAGHKQVAIIAKDFIGESINVLMANHVQGVIQLLLIKDPTADKDTESLHDLAIYLGGKVISEKAGSIVNKIQISDFVFCDKIFSDMSKTIITSSKKKNPELDKRIASIRTEIEKAKDADPLKKRLASLTNGMVTIKIGASTQIEATEKMYRYEDAVNATRAAMRDGYLVGGGIALNNAYIPKEHPIELQPTFKKYCEANIRQIAENCGKHPDTIVDLVTGKNNIGYNAMTDKCEDLLVAGVVDPFGVTNMAVSNSISIASQIINSGYVIVNDVDAYKDEEK